jgi:hypothetical protein
MKNSNPNFTCPKSAIIVNAKYIVCFSFWQIRLICKHVKWEMHKQVRVNKYD